MDAVFCTFDDKETHCWNRFVSFRFDTEMLLVLKIAYISFVGQLYRIEEIFWNVYGYCRWLEWLLGLLEFLGFLGVLGGSWGFLGLAFWAWGGGNRNKMATLAPIFATYRDFNVAGVISVNKNCTSNIINYFNERNLPECLDPACMPSPSRIYVLQINYYFLAANTWDMIYIYFFVCSH